jgi:hypothetical protein
MQRNFEYDWKESDDTGRASDSTEIYGGKEIIGY